ncbi:MAG: CopD family protein [Bacteroidetes bacterium]|nr:CopD family protein [Bacteroidota bacterium]
MYPYIKSLHIIFVVTWFAGMFYMPRLFIYNTEAELRNEPEKKILHKQFRVMMKRLWYGITWPSAIITLALGLSLLFNPDYDWYKIIFTEMGLWLLIKLVFVLFLYLYHFSLHIIFKQEMRGIYKYSSMQLRIWNEIATIFLFAIVMLVVVKQAISLAWGFAALIIFIFILIMAIRVYKKIRMKK